MQSSKRLHLVVQSVGRIPNTYFAETTCNWVDVRGRRASPPPGIDCSGRTLNTHGIHKSDLRLLGDDDERKVCIIRACLLKHKLKVYSAGFSHDFEGC